MTSLVRGDRSAIVETERGLVDESRAVLRKHGRSFAWAAPFLPRTARDDAALVYAYCRLVDDTADEAPSLAEARAGLQLLEEETFGARPPRPIVRAYLEVAARRDIPERAARGLLDGARADTEARVIMADDDALDAYCFSVAGTVGLMMRGILEGVDARALEPAVALGVGMQLTNICRDVAEDARMNRVYLPGNVLAVHGLSADLVLAQGGPATSARARRAMVDVVAILLARAERSYDRAIEGLPFLPWRARIGVAVALRLYRSIGLEVARLGVRALDRRAVVPVWRKALEVVAGVALALTRGRARGG